MKGHRLKPLANVDDGVAMVSFGSTSTSTYESDGFPSDRSVSAPVSFPTGPETVTRDQLSQRRRGVSPTHTPKKDVDELRPYIHDKVKYEAARALRNARIMAQGASDEDWGNIATNPHSPTGNGKFGYPIVWLKDYAIVYSPEVDQKTKQIFHRHGTMIPIGDAWQMVRDNIFEYIHLFDGPIPKEFEGIHEALDFFHRCGGAQSVEMPTHNTILEFGPKSKSDTPQLLSALAAAKVPKSCIKQWMLDSGCGCDLVSSQSIAGWRQ